MNVFKLHPSDDSCIELTIRNYNKETGSKTPWVTRSGSGASHYAVCPECDNPTVIVGLDADKKADEAGRAQPLHARHHKYNVAGVANYDEDAYNNCPLANPEAFSGTPIKRKPGKKSEEILALLTEEADAVKYFMERALGVAISPYLFEKMLRKFAEQEGHLYRAIGKLNLPYAVIYMAKNQCVAGKKPFTKVNAGSPFADAVKASQYFQLSRYNYIEQKPGAPEDALITFFIAEHVIPKKPDGEVANQVLRLHIEEEVSGTRKPLVTRDLEFDSHHFFNTVCKKRRERDIARDALASLIQAK